MKLKRRYLVIFLILFSSCVLYFLLRYIDNLPKKVIEYQGISLGNSKDEVFYVLGVPDGVLFPPEKSVQFQGMLQRFASKDEIRKNPSGEKGFNSWQYSKKGHRVDVDFEPSTGKVSSVGCYVSINDFVDADTCKVNGIRALDTEERVISILGKPDSHSISGVTKELSYPNLNMKIVFEKKYAYYIIVTSMFNQ